MKPSRPWRKSNCIRPALHHRPHAGGGAPRSRFRCDAGLAPRAARARVGLLAVFAVAGALTLHGQQPPAAPPGDPAPPEHLTQGFRFRSGVELINVTATVTDEAGRFKPGLLQDDFLVFEDDKPQAITHFSAERVPVSLGIALDTSESMAGEKIASAQDAVSRLLSELADPQDEFFLYRFSDSPVLLQDWTHERAAVTRALGYVVPNGRTALFDTVSAAIPLTARAQNRKRALVIISDGVDTTSRTPLTGVRQQIRQAEVLVYAIGIDCSTERTGWRGARGASGSASVALQRWPIPIPLPFPPGGRGGRLPRTRPLRGACGEPVDAFALRDMTDDSGGRTEVIHQPRDLPPATSNIADELSQQYYLGYSSVGKRDGRWHSIRVEIKGRPYRVRARRGYMAS